MRNSTKGKRLGAVAAAMVIAGFMLLLVAAAAAGIFQTDSAELLALAVLGVYALLGLAVVIGVIAALCQRLREIRGGEEEDAKKY